MAPRRRAVERATLRRTVTDRIVTAVLVLLAASGVMSVLPGRSQQAISRFACQAVTVGMGSCGAGGPDLSTASLGASRCPILAELDATVPEVRVRELTTDRGLAVQLSSTRTGESFLALGPADDSPLPEPLAGEPRTRRTVLPGAEIPARTEWFLPEGQGAAVIVDAVTEQHRSWTQRRSSLAVLGGFTGDGRDIPPPTLLYSRLDLTAAVLPQPSRVPAARPARSGPTAPRSEVRIDTTAPATLTFNRVNRQSSVVADLAGASRAQPLLGSVRWTRDAVGQVTSVVVAVVSEVALVKGEQSLPAGSVEVAYVSVPARSVTERRLVSGWLSQREGFTLGLQDLFGLSEPPPSDQLRSFLTRAASVLVLRYALPGVDGTRQATAAMRVRTELTMMRRIAWPDARLTLAASVAPQPNGTRRALVSDPGCGTP